MYKSPITIIESTIDSLSKAIIKQKDDAIFAEIQSSFGVDLDRGELIRALQYDRDQYNKGYADGKADATPKWIPVTERLPQEKGEICKNVILFMDDGLVTVGWLNEDIGYAFYLDTRNDFVSKVPISRCTHWMELPEAPKGE